MSQREILYSLVARSYCEGSSGNLVVTLRRGDAVRVLRAALRGARPPTVPGWLIEGAQELIARLLKGRR